MQGAASPIFDSDDADSTVWDQYGYAVPADYFQTGNAGESLCLNHHHGLTSPDDCCMVLVVTEHEQLSAELPNFAGFMQDVEGLASMMELDEAEPAAPEVPRKLVQSLHNVQVNAKVTSYNYDGLADSRSLVIILTSIAPRQLILIHGTSQVRGL